MNGFPLPPPPGLNLGDVYFTLFRHKWRIISCVLVGIAAAAAVNRFNPAPYKSEAKLFVRYIVSENKAFGPTANESAAKSPDQRGETIMKSEAEILGSLDIAKQVAETIGPDKIVPNSVDGKDSAAAAVQIKNNLEVFVAPGSSVINVTFSHPDPAIVQVVLRAVIERYRQLHVETHTANGTLGDFLSQETDQLRARLAQTEDELRKATLKAGIVSLEDAHKAYAEQLTALRRELFTAQAELAQRTAVLAQLNQRAPENAGPTPAVVNTPPEIVADYRSSVQQVELVQKMEQDALTQFTPESARVQELRTLLSAAREVRRQLEQDHPDLVRNSMARTDPEPIGIDPRVVATQVTASQAKIKALSLQLDELRRDAAKVDQMEGTIVELRRKKELQDANYRYYSASLEQSRINETLGNGRVSNLSQIQAPSPPFSDRRHLHKLLAMILGAGLFGGIGWAFLTDLYFDRSVKRPIDLERTLRVPLLLAIPALSRKQIKSATSLRLSLPAKAGAAPAVPEQPHPLQAFHETLRDRLIGYFESINLTHKPKLVAVTGLGPEAGVTTSAAGLARSLSETGEGNVLLVDMNSGPGASQQFIKGKPVRGLDEFLDTRDGTAVDQRLYVVAENNHGEILSRNIPQRFSKLLPKLKASDFDYIIFDMPPISQISITPRLAGFMDMVLLIVEAEKTDRDLVQRAAALLAETRTHVSVVLNKTRSYVPARLLQDSLSSC